MNYKYSYILFFVLLLFAACKNKNEHAEHKQEPAKEMYTCPMPQDSVFSDKPGKCPKCGMDLVKMEQPMPAHRDGVIESVECTIGDTVSAGTVLGRFAPVAS